MNTRLIAIFLSLILLSTLPVIVVANETNPFEFAPQILTETQMLPDPDLTNSPNIVVNGTHQNRFKWAHSTNDGVNLSWTHEPRMVYSWKPATTDSFLLLDQPQVCDFVMFTQDFEWIHEEVPLDVNVTIGYAVDMTGMFDSEIFGPSMFKLYIWLIDSSGNWNKIYHSYPPYSATVTSRHIDLNWFDLQDAWQGMVQDEDGYQEDPSDILRLAVGIAPLDRFRESTSPSNPYPNPYLNYSGTVTAMIKYIELVAFRDVEYQISFDPMILLVIGFVGVLVVLAYMLKRSRQPIVDYTTRYGGPSLE
ncbi:MAG: hypothetical protein RTU30_11790 [Candidatus Thorarchaeota archaeon]